MVLKTLEMQGFKSFPDKTELSFGKGITAVVGPNGSGKSNISDAVRWVLGETSTKSLRGSKMEDVIFGGTEKRKSQGFAQVVLTLDNSDGTLKDRGETVTVSRRYYRSGESEYKIDSEQVRRKDIKELFMDTGLGSNGYSSVGQGRIASIIESKGDGRRELFEEAAGISRFRHKRTDAQRRLEQAQENLVRLLDILNELELRVGPLKKQSEKANEFLKYAAEKKELEIGLWLEKIGKFTGDLRELEHKIDATNVSYELCEKEIGEIEDNIENVVAQVAEINVQIEETRESVSNFESEILKTQSEISVANEQIKHNDDTISRLKADIEAVGGDKTAIEKQIEEKEKTMKECQIASEEKKEELLNTTKMLENLSSKGEENSKKSAEISKVISELTMQFSQANIELSSANSSANEIENRMNGIDENIEQLNSELNAVEKLKEEQNQNISFLNEKINEFTNSMQGYKLRLDSKTKKVQELRTECENKSRLLSAKESKVKMLLDLEKNMDGYSGTVKSVINRASQGGLSGIHGAVSQLITVDDEYSTAIEVALGASMQNIVTDTEADAKRAIYYLKQNKLGRATFLPISAVKSRVLDERNLDDNLGFVAVASDIVECENKYKTIISSLLGRCVIAEDMDSAIGISKIYNNRFKIVTLDGQVINPGGSMSGGSRSKNAGILSRANLIETEKEEAEKIRKSLSELNEKLNSSVKEMNFASAEVQGAEAELRTANEDLIRAKGELKIIEERLSSVKDSVNSLLTEKNTSEERIKEFKVKSQKARQNADLIAEKISENEKQLEILNSNSRDYIEKRDDLRNKSEQINLEIISFAKDFESAKLSAEELKQRILTQNSKVVSVETEIKQVESSSETVRQRIAELFLKVERLKNSSAQSENDVKELVEKRNSAEKKSNDLRTFEKAKNDERSRLNSELVRLDERKIAMRKEYEDLKTKLYDEYELTTRQAQEIAVEIEDVQAANRRLHELKSAIKSLGNVNVGAIEEYKEVSERYEFLKEQVDDVEKSKSELLKIIDDLTSSMSEQFMSSFKKVNEQFKICFVDFFGGGKGELSLEDESDCLESAIEIKIQPPGKSVQNIDLFSGGEKSLAALALLFALLKVNPAPFCIYDEVEAALDDVNVERFAKYMRKMTDNTQFIAITHRRGTMEEADVLYGVTMQEKGVSKLLELQSAELASKMGLDA